MVLISTLCFSCNKDTKEDPPNYIPNDGIYGLWGTNIKCEQTKLLNALGFPIIDSGEVERYPMPSKGYPDMYGEYEFRFTKDSQAFDCWIDTNEVSIMFKKNYSNGTFYHFFRQGLQDTSGPVQLYFCDDTMFWKYIGVGTLNIDSPNLPDTLNGFLYAFIPFTYEHYESIKPCEL